VVSVLNIGLIKTILFIIAAIFPVYLLSKSNFTRYYRKFLLNVLLIHLVLLVIVTFKLHHFLLSEFNIPNTVTYILGAIPFLILFTRQKIFLQSDETNFLIISLVLLSIAVIIDLLSDAKIVNIPENDLLEEIFRIAGALMWLIYNILLFIRIKKQERNE
jgi:hypothetical protein